jgi:hypothetical protein
MLLPSNIDLKAEMTLLTWDSKKFEASGKLIETARQDNHLCDAMLYAWRECKHHGGDWEHNPMKRGTPEWYLAEERRMEEEAAAKCDPESALPWWDDGSVQ